MSLRQTHTHVHLEISARAYDEISAKLREAGYDHAFMESGGRQVIDMQGIAVTPILASGDVAVDGVEIARRVLQKGAVAVEDDCDQTFTPMPKTCNKWGCENAGLVIVNGFRVCPQCRGSYGAVS